HPPAAARTRSPPGSRCRGCRCPAPLPASDCSLKIWEEDTGGRSNLTAGASPAPRRGELAARAVAELGRAAAHGALGQFQELLLLELRELLAGAPGEGGDVLRRHGRAEEVGARAHHG